MTDIKNRDHILEAIDQLRRRKARPDIQRICNFLTRRFAIDQKDTKADLQKCVENEIVYKVEYKGSISYRNAAKKSYGQICRENSDSVKRDRKKFANIVTTAVADLILEEPDHLEYGVPADELIRKIFAKTESKYSKKIVLNLLQREVDNGGLIKMDSGNYSLGPSSQNESEKSDEESEFPQRINTSSDLEPPPIKIRKKPGPKPGKKQMEREQREKMGAAVRLGGRRKITKKVFDPSDVPQPTRRRGRPLGSLNRNTIKKQNIAAYHSASNSPSQTSQSALSTVNSRDAGGVCSVCHLQGKRGECDRMVSCRDCCNKAHFTCLNTEDGMLRMHPDNTWQCPHCKTCVVCFETSDAGPLTVCSICADAYHSACHEPKIAEKTKGTSRWLCCNCQMEPLLTKTIKEEKCSPGEYNNLVVDQNTTPTPSTSPHSSFYKTPVPSPTPPALSPQNNNEQSSNSSHEFKFNVDSPSEKNSEEENGFDPSIPDASNWSFDQVYKYFVKYFPEEAFVFKEQEIDGHSLLLMKRVDVLTSLNLKLGPALKIYRHVLKLQVRRDDHKLYWL